MFKIFIAEPILKTIIEDESKKAEASRSFLYKVLKERKTLYVAAATPDKSWADILKSQHKIIVDYSLSDYINKIKDHPETVLENPSSIFILDIPITEAEKIQTSFGVVCMSGKSLTARFLIDTNDEHTIDEQEAFGNGWETVLKSVKGIPSNALLLTDRYLFSSTAPKYGNGVDNVQSILDVLLPKKFIGEYHVTIVFDNENKSDNYKFNDIVYLLDNVKKALHRDYPINMEVLGITPDCDIYDELHNRRIVSNYYIIKVEHKLAAFNKNISTCLQTITPQVLFTVDSLNKNSTPPLKAIDHAIATIREFSKTASKNSNYFYALNGERKEKCMGINNRLLK